MSMRKLGDLLCANAYPGRGIVLGCSEDGTQAVVAYFIMGRSENSRNRIFVAEGENLRTRAFDEAKLADPSLVIYYPVRTMDGRVIVTNGDQTDTVYEHLQTGSTFEEALRTRTFEPDPPILTPRISGLVELGDSFSYRLSILKSADGDSACAQRHFYEYETPQAGKGHFIHTYKGDGDPVPSFEGEPKAVAVTGDIGRFTDEIWSSLNADNKVSLFVRTIDLATGKAETRIRNKLQGH